MRRDTFGNTPACRTLDKILEEQYPRLASKVGAKINQFSYALSHLKSIKDKEIAKSMILLYRESRVKVIMNYRFPEELKTYMVNILCMKARMTIDSL